LKKILLSLLLLTSLYAESKIYLGSSVGFTNEKFTDDVDAKSSTGVLKLKAGYGDRKLYAIEFSVDYTDNKSKIFSANDGVKYGLNVELVKAFDLDVYVLPFFKAGFGSGSLEIDGQFQDKLHYGSFNLSTGIFIPINEHFDFELGYDYKYVSYEGIDTIADQVSYDSNANTVFFGFNVRY